MAILCLSITAVSSLLDLRISVMRREFHTHHRFSKSAVEFHPLTLQIALSSPQVTSQSDPLPSSHKSSRQPLQGIQADPSHSHTLRFHSHTMLYSTMLLSLFEMEMNEKVHWNDKKIPRFFFFLPYRIQCFTQFLTLFFTRYGGSNR